MNNAKEKISRLIQKSSNDETLIFIFNDQTFNLDSFVSDKADFLDVHEVRLATNKKMNIIVIGLEEAVNKIRKTDIPVIVTNLVDKQDKEVIIYTDPDYTILLGVIK